MLQIDIHAVCLRSILWTGNCRCRIWCCNSFSCCVPCNVLSVFTAAAVVVVAAATGSAAAATAPAAVIVPAALMLLLLLLVLQVFGVCVGGFG